MIKGGFLTVGSPSACFMRFNFGIDIACSPWLAEKRVGPVDRLKTE
jgi:hypothetical protein